MARTKIGKYYVGSRRIGTQGHYYGVVEEEAVTKAGLNCWTVAFQTPRFSGKGAKKKAFLSAQDWARINSPKALTPPR